MLSVKQFAEAHPAFTEPALRNLIFESKPRPSSRGTIPGNGFGPALLRVGRRVLIDEDKFFELLRQHRQ
ncbi:hypothetical protein [Thiohalomonas denitrificans]|uniref:hypothetical protein n=1 Tax=Thiohalomonas denitrificans TaxID=415747 RepID=UPI0026F33624|nr:hypothetical protein [Thiohalomonas denitrificans]